MMLVRVGANEDETKSEVACQTVCGYEAQRNLYHPYQCIDGFLFFSFHYKYSRVPPSMFEHYQHQGLGCVRKATLW